MVAMTAAMTGVVLVCLSVLVYFKLAKKRRRKKIVLPSVYSVEKVQNITVGEGTKHTVGAGTEHYSWYMYRTLQLVQVQNITVSEGTENYSWCR